MDIRTSRLPLALAALVVLLLASACSTVRDAIDGDDPTPELIATAVPTTEPTPLARHYIGNTGGLGVSLRSDCATDARLAGAWAESTEVAVLQEGEGRCAGWTLAEVNGTTSWVSHLYLITDAPASAAPVTLASAPAPSTNAAPQTPVSTATITPANAPASTPTSAPVTNPGAPVPPMALYGPANQGDIIGILVDGGYCRAVSTIEEPASPTGYLWSTLLSAGQCGATAGSTLTFTLNGASASEQLEWSPGGTPPNLAYGITLTTR